MLGHEWYISSLLVCHPAFVDLLSLHSKYLFLACKCLCMLHPGSLSVVVRNKSMKLQDAHNIHEDLLLLMTT